jgi:hypothetical protein
MKRLLFGALCASILFVAGAVVPAVSAGAAVPAPGVPTNVSVVAGGNQVTISWSAPTSGPTPTKYQVAGTIANPVCSAVTTTSCTITFPPTKPASTAGQIVKYKVRAFNGAKAGAYSAQILTLFGKPTIPTGITVEPRMAGVYVHWNLSTGGKYPVTGYTATASNGNTCTAIAGDWCTVPGLTNGTAYNFTVTATNAVGTSAPSAVSSDVIAGSPRAPTAPVVAVAGPGSANVTFTLAGNNGAAISWYTLTAHDLSNPGSPSDGFQWTSPASPLYIPGLQAGHTYNFTITATNSRGEGPSSPASNSVTMPDVPGAPTDLVATALTTSATVSFTAPADNGSSITFYTITAHDLSHPGSATDGKLWGNNASPVPMPGLQAGHTYNFTISAANAVGSGPDSAPSNSVTIPSPPDAPTAAVATAGVNSASVAFTPGADNGSPITYFIVTAYDQTNPLDPSNGTQWAGGSSPVVKAALVTGHSYTFTVAAANGIGISAESAPSNAVVVL